MIYTLFHFRCHIIKLTYACMYNILDFNQAKRADFKTSKKKPWIGCKIGVTFFHMLMTSSPVINGYMPNKLHII